MVWSWNRRQDSATRLRLRKFLASLVLVHVEHPLIQRSTGSRSQQLGLGPSTVLIHSVA